MSRITIEQLRSVLPMQAVYKWKLAGILMPGTSIEVPNAADLDVRCVSTELPKKTESPMEISIRGHKIRQPGIYDYSHQIVMTFIESTNNFIHEFLNDWLTLCHDPETGASVPKADLEATILIHLLDVGDDPTWQYELIGCYPNDYELGTLDGQTADSMQPTITLNYDYFKMKKL